jgi:acetoin utilization protein AcuB
MRLAQIMSEDVFTTSPEAPLTEALDEMHARHVHHLVVVSACHVVGVLSQRDRAMAHTGATVRDAMQSDVISATVDTTVQQAANLMRGRSIGCLPVFDGDELVGIVTTTDLLELLGRGAERAAAAERKAAGRRLMP